jgi:hypothetical protein
MKTILSMAAAMVLLMGTQVALASNPVEFWGCQFNEGKDMADLMAWTEEWTDVIDALPDDGYNAWVMTPMFSSTMSAVDFLWVGAWPDYKNMGAGFDGFFNGEEGSASFAKFVEISTCEQHVLFSSIQVRENTGN